MMMTIAEAARHRGVSESRIKQYIAEKRLSAQRVGKRLLLVNSSDLDRLLVKANGRPPEKFRDLRKK